MLGPFLGFRGMYDDFADNTSGPVAEVRESQNAVMIELELPRYKENELQVEADNDRGTITVIGTKKQQQSQRQSEFEHLLFASTPLGNFRRTFRVSPQLYNMGGLSWSLADGVLSIVVPKLPRQAPAQPLTILGSESGALTTNASRQEMQQLHQARNVLTVKKKEDANHLTYECDVAPFVTRDHINIQLVGRMLNIAVQYMRHVTSGDALNAQQQTGGQPRRWSESSESATYSTSLAVPQGTSASDIKTSFEAGKLTITLDKHAAAAPSAIDVKPGATAQQ